MPVVINTITPLLLFLLCFQAQAEAEFEVQRCELQQKMVEAERRLKQLIEHRDVLQRQLEKAAEEATGEGECLVAFAYEFTEASWLCFP